MVVIAIRHLPTDFNLQGILQGRSDKSINYETINRSQIESNLRILQHLTFDQVYVSPLKRTKETALEYGFDNYQEDENLIEFDFGRYENVSRIKMLEEVGEFWLEHFTQVDFGESIQDLRTRLMRFIEENENHETILIFSHGVVIRSLMALSGLIDFDKTNRLSVRNNSITIISFP